MENKIIYKEESAAIIGAIFEVHKRLGPGLLEKVYQEALTLELQYRNIPFFPDNSIYPTPSSTFEVTVPCLEILSPGLII